MHERTSFRDELSAAMLDAPELCAQCGAILTDDDDGYLCVDCTIDDVCTASPSACEPWETRFPSPWIPRAIDWPAVVMLASFLAVAVGTWGWQQVQAESPAYTLTYESRSGHGTLVLPYIGTPAYSASCTITRAWEDGSAAAYCTEDGGMYVYDPDGDIVTGKQPGWYSLSETR